jgi:pimeloyl-ACP methyl ester carboxylesterase
VSGEIGSQKEPHPRILKQTLPRNRALKYCARNRREFLAGVLALFLLSQFACLSAPSHIPNLKQIFVEARETKGKRPIIVIPGILGSELVHRQSKEVVWPSLFGSAHNRLGLPMSPDLDANRDDLSPGKIIEGLKFASILPEVYVYRGLLDALRNDGGYKERDWDNPGPGGDKDSVYTFPYDWRRDNVETARELIHRIEALKQKLNRPDLRFNIIAHSMGGVIARYAAMYGDADLPNDGVAPTPNWSGAAHIQRIVMLGTPNQGSMDAFASILRGYSLTEGVRRLRLFSTLSKEVAFSCPSVFELLPHAPSARFLDESLKPMSIDLYDPAMWIKYGWSATAHHDFNKPATDGAPAAPDKSSNAEKSARYLAAVLHRAQKFHEALDVFANDSPVPLLSFAGDCEPTLEAPLVRMDKKSGRWLTLTEPNEFRNSSGRKVTRKDEVAAMYVPGDGRVTRNSALGKQSGAGGGAAPSLILPIAYAMFGCELHGSLPSNKTLQDNALSTLVNEIVK